MSYCCRAAVEAACIEAARRRRLQRGESHADVEHLLSETRTTNTLTSLALFDDAQLGGKVLAKLNQWDTKMADAFQWCREGTHHGAGGDRRLMQLRMTDCEELADKVRSRA